MAKRTRVSNSFFIPMGRISDLHKREDADRLMINYNTARLFDDLKVTIFSSRDAMKAFIKTNRAKADVCLLKPVVFDAVPNPYWPWERKETLA